jgi:hypothetical protein
MPYRRQRRRRISSCAPLLIVVDQTLGLLKKSLEAAAVGFVSERMGDSLLSGLVETQTLVAVPELDR